MKTDWHIRSQSIPQQARVQVRTGQQIAVGDLIASIDVLPGPLVRVEAAAELGVAPRDLDEQVVRRPGTEVKQGQILALANAFGYPLTVSAPADGLVAQVSRSLGCIYVRSWTAVPREDVTIPLLSRDERDRFPAAGSATGGMSFGVQSTSLDSVKSTTVVKEYRVSPGDVVQRRQILAVTFTARPEMVAEVNVPVLSPCAGVVKSVDRDAAVVVIEPREATGVRALYPGQVMNSADDRVELAFPATRFGGSYGIGGTATGPLVVEQQPEPSCIWVVPRSLRPADLAQARAVGVAGIWAASARHSDMEQFFGAERVRSVTGAWDGPTVVLSEGFGNMSMAEDALADLRQLHGRQAIISGITHLRAGAIRPELLIPTDDTPAVGEPAHEWSDAPTLASHPEAAADDDQTIDWQPGVRVRCVSGQRQGQVGVLTSEARVGTLPSGVTTHLVDVVWYDGTAGAAPTRNLTVSKGGTAHD